MTPASCPAFSSIASRTFLFRHVRRSLRLLVGMLLLGSAACCVAQSGDVVVSTNTTWATGTYNVTSLTVQSGATLTVGGGSTVIVSGAILVTGNSNILLQGQNTTAQINNAWAGTGVTMDAASVQVDPGSTINADGQGYGPQAGPGYAVSGGGSYGGLGGRQAASTVYGSSTAPVDLGSGGDTSASIGGPGGGALQLTVSGTLTNNGVISANGGTWSNNPGNGSGNSGSAGGGSGGSVYVTAGTLTGAGIFTANGGPNASGNGDGGGGGRVAVYSSSSVSYTGMAASTATGGAVPGGHSAESGSVGTVVFIDTSAPNGNLSVYQNFTIPANSHVQYNSLTVNSGATVTVGGGSQVSIAGALNITGTMFAQSINNTGQVDGLWEGQGIKIFAGSLLIGAPGSIVADNQGYGQQQGPGAAPGGTGNGGSYGGVGGQQSAGSVYGSANNPTDLGSGGGVYQGTAGAGGGAVQVEVSGTLTNNGLISANGQSVGGFVGAGSGGSINLVANTIAGTGTIDANGGSNSTSYGDGGGGGRIAITYVTNIGVGESQATAAGGTGNPGGVAGTVEFINAPVSAWILPTQSAIYGTAAALEWFTDSGYATSVSLAGPQTAVIATGAGPFSSASLDTTQYPDGAYQLVLATLDGSGNTVQEVLKEVVINNSITWHSGTLTADQTWAASQVHGLDGNVIVPAGITLTIQPGAVVKALAGAQIIVEAGGTLIATGSAGLPVTFTTFDDYSIGGDTDFNQGVSLPDPGEWNGISVVSGGTFASNTNTVIRYANTLLTGTLGANTTLYSTQVYTVTGTLTVPSGVTLNVLPGAIVKFAAGAGLDVQPGATMTADGTLAQPIYFTSINDISIGGDTDGSGGDITPAAGDWNSMVFDGATVSMQHVQVQYGGGPVMTNAQTGMIETTDNANVTISDSVIADSFYIGIQTGYPNNGGDTLTVTDTTFYGIEDRAINVYPGSTAHVVNDTFDGNATGIMAHGGTADVENSAITNSVGTQFGSVAVCCGGVFSAFSNNDVYSTAADVANYVGTPDVTGQNGNISVAPVYMNGALHDYRPTYGSPLIDAANATVPNYPLTDAFGLARYNDPLAAKTGTADGNGNYPDIGAFEFVQTAPSDLDMTASNVQGPATAIAGSQVQVSWTVTNIGTGTAYGPWHDGVYLVTDPDTNPVATLAGVVLEGQAVVLGPGGSYSATATVTVPGVTAGSHRWEVVTNVLGEIFEGANTGNNTAVSLSPVETDLPPLVPGATPLAGAFPGPGQSSFYKVVPSATQSIQVQLALNAGVSGSVQLFVGAGYVPSPQHYDYEQVEFNSATATVVIPSGSAQTYYVMAYAQTIPVSPAAFSISATAVQFSLTRVTPNTAITSGNATLTFIGGGFTSNTSFLLVGPTGGTYNPTSVFVEDSSHADVTFAMGDVPVGTYAAQAINGSTVTLANALTTSASAYGGQFSSTGNSALQVTLQTPEAFRAGFPSIVTLQYTNNGGVDIAAPMIYLSATNATLAELPAPCSGCSPNLEAQVGTTFNSGLVLGISNSGPAGVLPAGASGTIQFLATPTATGTTSFYIATDALPLVETKMEIVNINVDCVGSDGCIPEAVSVGAYKTATSFCNSVTPPGADPNGWPRACMQMLANAGYTYTAEQCLGRGCAFGALESTINGFLPFQNFNNLLAADATAMSSGGDYEYDVQKLLAYELRKDGLQQFNQTYHQGAFGFGPSQPFDIKGYFAFGALLVQYPDGSQRNFAVAAGTPNTLLGVPGDYGVVTIENDGSYLLTESDGTAYHFPATYPAAIDYITDRNGNKTTLTYSNGNMTSAMDAFGNTISFQYDSNGHITQFTDSVGRVTTYTYNEVSYSNNGDSGAMTKGYFLATKTDAAGTTTYTWNTGGPLYPGYFDDSCIATFCNPPIGLASVAYPDGTHTYFQYDLAGRIIAQYKDGNAEAVSYNYNSNGSVTTTDALGHSTQVQPNVAGVPLSITDPLGDLTQYRYDAESKLIGEIGPLGDSSSAAYDAMGNATSINSADGNLTSLAYTSDHSLLSLTDPRGNAMQFGFDGNFDATSQTYPNGNQIKSTFDASGRLLTRTNRRGNTVTYTYGANGQLAGKTYSNGSQSLYVYDSHNNLQSVTSAAGMTSYTYDSADRMASLTNPDGTSLHFTYNSGGQRTSMTDSTGFVTNYLYDSAGRLSGLTDGAGATIVSYTYDGNGRLATKKLGNGTSTSLTYDANGNPLSVINYAATNAIISEYDYKYDAEGRPISMQAPSGAWAYAYDRDGQLTSVTTPTESIQYAYDTSGNRTEETANGAPETFQPNNLNEYTMAGNSAYQYDADGNLIAGNGSTYTYDDENHLLTMASATGTWSFQYDGLGNRVASVHNGTITHYLIDPAGFGNIEAEFNGTGQVTAHYTYGLDLTTSTQSSGTANYYHFDGTGNTAQITNASGTVVDSYSYLPFGEETVLASSVANPFTYNGELGVRDEGSGLYFMRNRWYSPTLGRFQQLDPVGFAGGENLYEYAGNSPLHASDPLGTAPDYFSIGAGFIIQGGIQINLHTGETFISLGASTGAGASAVVGTIQSSPEERAAPGYNAGQETSNFLGGMSYNAGLFVGPGGAVTGNGRGGAALELGYGAGGHGGSANYAVSTNSTGVQNAFTGLNNLTGGWLFGDKPQGVLQPPPLPTNCPGCSAPPPNPCGSCIFNKPPAQSVPNEGAIDPNGKITSGFGDQGYVPAGTPIVYTIYFENQPTATLPAQSVTVTDSLAGSLDWSTVQLNQIAFNNVTLNTPSGVQTYNTQASVSTDPNPVSVNVSLNPSTGILTWTMQSVDPATGSAPANPLAGFLPPNNSANAGSGYVTFSVMPKAGLANGTAISNQASVVFDANAAIPTNTVTNTVDSSSVTSSISPLPATTTSTSIPVSWTGSDPSGSGIASYNIYVSIDGSTYSLWLSATQLTSSTYTALPNHSYTFYSIATNNVGMVQPSPVSPQTVAVSALQPAVTVTPAANTIAPGLALNVDVTVTSSSGSVTGSVVLSLGTYSSTAVVLSSGAATFTVPASALPVGSDILTVTYTPDNTSSIMFTTAQGTATVTVGAPAPVAALSPTTLAFTSATGATSPAQTVQLSNTGNAALNLAGISLTGTGSSSFTQTNNCGASLAANASCTISVVFAPASVGTLTAALSVADDAAGSPQTITLTGNSTAAPTFQLTASPSTQSVSAGATALYSLQVLPQGGSFTDAVHFSVTGLPSGATASFLPASVTPGSAGASSTLSITTPTNFTMLKGQRSLNTTPLLAFVGIGWLAFRRNRRRLALCFLLFATAAGVTALGGCGGAPAPHTVTYSLSVTATSGTQSQSTPVTLILHN